MMDNRETSPDTRSRNSSQEPWGALVVILLLSPKAGQRPTSQPRLLEGLSRQRGAHEPGWRRRCHLSRAGKLKRQALVSDLVRSYWSVPHTIELSDPGFQPQWNRIGHVGGLFSCCAPWNIGLQVQTCQRHLDTSQRSNTQGSFHFECTANSGHTAD